MQKIYLVLSTGHMGGAEKRFVGLWRSLCTSDLDLSLILVVSPKLYQMLMMQEGNAAFMEKFTDHIIQYDISGGFRKFKKAVHNFILKHTQKGDILHFIGDHPLISGLGRKQVYSITQSSFKNLNTIGKIGQIAGIARSDVIDILDPAIFEQVKKIFFYKKHRLFRTSNSFCDIGLFTAVPFGEKKDWFVFLGRFEPMKQAVKLLNGIPAVYDAIKSRAGNDLHFFFFGRGSQEPELTGMLQEERFRGLPITLSFNEQPSDVLARSKVFFSLQWHNNYPSVSLIEAMAAGNIPLVTDVGQTRWLARPEFSYYVPEHFSESDLVNAVLNIYAEDSAILEQKSVMARQFILDNHTLEKMRDYYLSLYAAC